MTRVMTAFNPSAVLEPHSVMYLGVDQSGLRDLLRQGLSSLTKYSARSWSFIEFLSEHEYGIFHLGSQSVMVVAQDTFQRFL